MPRPIPIPSEATFRFNSIVASSISSRMIELRCSETLFAAAPRPRCRPSPPRVGMSSPIDPLREKDSSSEAEARDEPRVWAPAAPCGASAAGLRPFAELGTARRDRAVGRRQIGRHFALRTCLDEARLQLAYERSVLGQRLGELRLRAALSGGALFERLQPGGPPFDLVVGGRHFFVGGSSPVSVRQMPDDVRRETTVASAPRPP